MLFCMDALKQKISNFFSGTQSLNPKLVWTCLAIAAVSAFALNYLVNQSQTKTIEASATQEKSSTPAAEISVPELYVHVVGEVGKPGIYLLPIGSRLVDAIFAADGFTKKADERSVNLARQLTDGEQIEVFALGANGDTGQTPTASRSAGLISLNRASAAELEELPGVGPALAGRMVDWRSANGGFKSKDDLQNVSGIGTKLFASIEKLVTL